jgi:hypothetical protein
LDVEVEWDPARRIVNGRRPVYGRAGGLLRDDVNQVGIEGALAISDVWGLDVAAEMGISRTMDVEAE